MTKSVKYKGDFYEVKYEQESYLKETKLFTMPKVQFIYVLSIIMVNEKFLKEVYSMTYDYTCSRHDTDKYLIIITKQLIDSYISIEKNPKTPLILKGWDGDLDKWNEEE